MKKKLFFVIQILIATVGLFAKQPTLDEAISEVSEKIKERYAEKIFLAICDFELPKEAKNKEMSNHIRDKLQIELQNLEFIIATRDSNDNAIIEKEIALQHESGDFDANGIISLGKKVSVKIGVYGSVKVKNSDYELKVTILNFETGEKYIIKKNFANSSEISRLLGRDSEEKKVAQGFGAEINKNSLAFVAPAASVSFDYNILKKVSLGFKIFASWDMYEKNNNFITLEPLASLRFYLVSHGGKPGTGVFLEVIGGTSILSIDSDIRFVANAGIGYGYRFAFNNFYIEPEIRGGYPYIAGAGISTGFRF